MTEPTKGYLVVASRTKFFYVSACNLIESILDFDPDAKVCLVTEERFLDDRGRKISDQIVYCDDHKRAKLFGMAKSPYDITFYIDADCEVEHEDITTIFDLLDGNDLSFTGLPEERSYCYAELHFPGGKFELCGGVCLYDMRNPLVREFMQEWYDLTVAQYGGTWWPTKEDGVTWDEDLYPRSLARWDQFSLWWLVNKEPKYKELNVGILDDDARWNWFTKYRKPHNKKPIVIRHYSSAAAKQGTYV
tara:strand:- start:4236 stop:4976 length:741 start_codon:yes stop_codon:yes gene_type:complete